MDNGGVREPGCCLRVELSNDFITPWLCIVDLRETVCQKGRKRAWIASPQTPRLTNRHNPLEDRRKNLDIVGEKVRRGRNLHNLHDESVFKKKEGGRDPLTRKVAQRFF